MSNDSLRSLYRKNIDVVRSYVAHAFPGMDLRESEDFDRDSVILTIDNHVRVLISHEFLSDFGEKQTLALLELWRVNEAIRNLRLRAKRLGFRSTLLITTNGAYPQMIDRIGSHKLTTRQAVDRLEGVLPKSQARSELYNRVLDIRVDGVPLGDLKPEMRGDPELFHSYSKGYADVLGVAYLLDAAGYRNFEIHHRKGTPDLVVDLEDADEGIFIDFVRAVNPEEQSVADAREEINAELAARMRDDETVRHATEGKFVSITLPEVPAEASIRNAIVDEILAFTSSLSSDRKDGETLEPFDRRRFPLLAGLNAQSYFATGSTSLSVQEGAKTFDPYAPYRRVAEIVKQKSRERYNVTPLWLLVSLADTSASFTPEGLLDPRRIPEITANGTPFNQILVGSAGDARIYRRGESSIG